MRKSNIYDKGVGKRGAGDGQAWWMTDLESKIWGRPVRCRELDLMMLMGPFQLGIFCESVHKDKGIRSFWGGDDYRNIEK